MYKKISLYLLSLIANVGIAMVAPILASLALDFPGYSASMVAMIATTPAITLIPGMFVATALSSKPDRKNISSQLLLW